MTDFEMPLPSNKTAEEAVRPLLAVCITLVVLNTLFVAIRFTARLYVRQLELAWDDWFLIPSFMCNIVGCVVGILIAHYMSIGNGPANVPVLALKQYDGQLLPTLKLVYATSLILIPGYTFARLSVLTLYLRIFMQCTTRVFIRITIALTMAMAIAFFTTSVFLCHPVQYFWNRTLSEGHCLDLNFFYRSSGLPNVLIQVSISLLPIPAVWSLPISRRRKLFVSFVFLIGIIAVVATIARWVVYAHQDVVMVSPDSTAKLVYMNIIESSCYLIGACLPVSFPFFEFLMPARLRLFIRRFIASTAQTNVRTRTRTPSERFGRVDDVRGSDSSAITDGNDHDKNEASKTPGISVGVSHRSSGSADLEQGVSTPYGEGEAIEMADVGSEAHGSNEADVITDAQNEVSQQKRIDNLLGV